MKITKLILILIVTTIGLQSCFMDNDDKLDLANDINTGELIKKDSDLYKLIVMVTNPTDPIFGIVCVEFSYSFLVYTYDQSNEIIDETIVSSDDEFYTFLDNLPMDHSISISYPIETILEDGTPFSITTNEELKEAINECAQEEIIGNCNSLFQMPKCVWRVPFIDGEDNTYASGVFTVNSDTSVTFDFQNNEYTGTWIFFYIENVLNFNINLAGNSQVAQDWNINFNVDYIDGTLLLTSNTHNYSIKKACEFMDEIEVGDQTILGGIVAYDKGYYTDGWRYIEAHSTDLPIEEWGCLSGDIIIAEFEDIGKGFMNSAAIANYHLDLVDYPNNPAVCNPVNDGTISALTALLLEHNSPDGNPDWFLPSIDELIELYENLHLDGLGNFEDEIYWSSTQSSESEAKALDFSTGDVIEIPKDSIGIRARAIRYF